MNQTIDVAGNGCVLVEQQGHTLIVTMNRPAVRNAVNFDLSIGVGEAMEFAEETSSVRTVILTGAGDKAFCAGADLKAAAAGEFSIDDDRLARWGFAGYVQHAISKPTIAAVNGFALGGGTEIALASDLVVALDTATFGLPEVKRGVFAGAGGAFRLPRQIPTKIAMEAMFTGRPISAARAYELGLVNALAPAGELMNTALDLAEVINANAPLSVRATKRIAMGIDDHTVPAERDDWARTRREGRVLSTSEDSGEGMRAFAEKREPRWSGR
ncbi:MULTISPECIES: enoyl-CoA hydratase-related protein [Nocardiaceae]|uniref:Crotonobetainyl-CoA hydratase n=1 Tax=Rhodococcoides corynebacterioides TaxID=53972 RepID=A0ABS2KMX8_9NOCA|nr:MULTISPECIES: enoyl-CoA hydratase-related protein [Rhodococcus]MBM7413302.1 crotonobetainyl-CoA hydratase [Rhodococcus corynebacterioides]MBP1115765.1 crotonobetainyl-CoA hydratase [Rhodococcus sp. PvP016]MBY6679307.1 enoyl-CoA hydratase/isomerase family protein [Rhodococcus sp. BP-332]